MIYIIGPASEAVAFAHTNSIPYGEFRVLFKANQLRGVIGKTSTIILLGSWKASHNEREMYDIETVAAERNFNYIAEKEYTQ